MGVQLARGGPLTLRIWSLRKSRHCLRRADASASAMPCPGTPRGHQSRERSSAQKNTQGHNLATRLFFRRGAKCKATGAPAGMREEGRRTESNPVEQHEGGPVQVGVPREHGGRGAVEKGHPRDEVAHRQGPCCLACPRVTQEPLNTPPAHRNTPTRPPPKAHKSTAEAQDMSEVGLL